jgi:tetratricopeptide (TPR) repeat protein
MLISENDLQEVKILHEKGLCLQAYRRAQEICPLPKWEGTDARLLAAHLAYHLGAVKTGSDWTTRAWRKDKKHPRALFYHAIDVLHMKGALPALIFLEKYGGDFLGDEKLTAWWYSLHAEVFAHLRDFKTADRWHEKAFEAAPREPWVWTAKSYSLELQDRYEESLEMSRKAYAIEASQRSSITQLAHILTLLEHYDEALQILNEGANRLENASVVRQLADLQTELGMHAEALASLEKIVELTPMREGELEQWLYASLSDAAYLNGDIEKAIRFADISSTPFHLKIKERLEKLDGTEKRVRLKLGFVRQHQMTCAPATISNIARFWQKKAEHLELADEMCYDGTPAYKERIWANENNWETREFTVNWTNTVELINRGVPFALATIQPGGGHLQAIVGYDEKRKTMLVRDPFYQRFDEFAAEELLENQKSNGPRGFALVPREKAELLRNLNLEESREYDFHFAVDDALENHDRERAMRALEAMEKEFPDHRLTWSARWTLARYDANTPKLLEAVENLLKKFPDDINLKLSYLSISHEFATREERLGKLEEFSKAEKTDPLFWQMFGQELGLDAHKHGRALRWLYKSLRRLPTNALTYRFIADVLWSQRRFQQATVLYRFAACLNDKDEQFAYSYFLAARHLKKETEALQFLRDRFERFGHRSHQPVRTLFYALRELGLTVEAFEALENALAKRPDDGELKLFVAEAKARFGKKAEAEKLLVEAENQAPRTIWLRNAAMIAEMQGNLGKSLEYWREIIGIEPSAYDAHESIAFLLSAIEGKASAQNYLRKVSKEFSFNRNLQKLRLSYLREETTEAIAVLRDLVRLNPQDAWSQRELSRWLCRVKKYEKALEAARAAVQIDPNDSLNCWAIGMVLSETEKTGEAAKAFEKAITLSVDADYALHCWMDICRTKEEKMAILRFMRGELGRQISFGAGIAAYREQGKRLLEPPVLLGGLKKIQAENKDSWFAASAVVQQLVDMHKLGEALELAEQNAKRFPLIYQVWYDLSLIHKLRGENENEIGALRQAVSINAYWSFGFQQLCEALQRAGRLAEAEEITREALTRMPLDQYLYGYLAEVEWKLGKKEQALKTARRAVSIAPEYDWAWQVVKSWSEELKQPGLAAEMAREITVQKPSDVSAWLRYAQILDDGKFSQAQLAAAEEALKLEPQNSFALAIKANSLADARRFDEAIAVCQTGNGHRPEQLRYVEAGIEATRGNYEESVVKLERLAADSPDYYPAWERLAGIYRDWRDKKFDYLRVTREMTRLAPQEPTAFGYLGEACLLNNRREEAKKAYQQAFTLSPEYGFAGGSLFDLYFEDGEVENCRAVLKLLDEFVQNENTIIRQIAFFSKQNDPVTTAILWKKLCLSEKAHRGQFEYALGKMLEAKFLNNDFVWETLRDVSFETNANPLVGAFYIERCWEKEGEKACAQRLGTLRSNEKVWAEAMIKFMEILLNNNPKSLRNFINENERILKNNDSVWASTGYNLNALKDYAKAKEWFSGWRRRKKIEPWILWNFSIVLRRSGENAKASLINREALKIEPDDTVDAHLTMLGLDEIYAGNYENAARMLGQINPQTMTEWDKFFHFLLETNLEIYRKASGGLLNEAQNLTKNMVKISIGLPNLWEDNIMRENFDRSLRLALNLSQSGWLNFSLRLRVLLARFGL